MANTDVCHYVPHNPITVSTLQRVKNPQVYAWAEGPDLGVVRRRTKKIQPPPYNLSLYYGANVSTDVCNEVDQPIAFQVFHMPRHFVHFVLHHQVAKTVLAW